MRFDTSLLPSRLRVDALALGAVLALAACDDDSGTGPTPPAATSEITVDASQAPAYVRLDNTATAVSVADPSTSSAWDLSFFATGVTVNGGAAGPGGTVAYCLCANENATDAAVMAMTPENQLAAFESVEATDIPAESAFEADVLNPAISGWYSGTPGGAVTAVPSRSWILRKGTTSALLGKFRVTGISGATATHPGSVTFEYAIQPSAGAPFGATQTETVDVSTGPVYFDLATGSVSTAASWDVQFSGYDIRLNGGVSGSGSVSAVVDEQMPFGQITAQYAGFVPPQAFRADAFGGVFASSPWYRYNITGTDNQIWPTFNVYLVKRGDEVFKVQLTGYYSETGTPRQITIRSARLQ
ncbi:MAG TPA: HmuY family protein [Gemmatimonadaceae bacterium]|nr:HmuY family protein [Gemmatimonadaceae bacterium]